MLNINSDGSGKTLERHPLTLQNYVDPQDDDYLATNRMINDEPVDETSLM